MERKRRGWERIGSNAVFTFEVIEATVRIIIGAAATTEAEKNKEAIDDGRSEEENGAYDKNVQCKH